MVFMLVIVMYPATTSTAIYMSHDHDGHNCMDRSHQWGQPYSIWMVTDSAQPYFPTISWALAMGPVTTMSCRASPAAAVDLSISFLLDHSYRLSKLFRAWMALFCSFCMGCGHCLMLTMPSLTLKLWTWNVCGLGMMLSFKKLSYIRNNWKIRS